MSEERFRAKLEWLTRDELKRLRPGPVGCSELDPFLTAWARKLFQRVASFVYRDFEHWEADLTRNVLPSGELGIWEAIARAYEEYLAEHPDIDKRETVEQLMHVSSGGMFDKETKRTLQLRWVYRRTRQRMEQDPKGTLRDVARSLGLDPDSAD